MNDRGVSGFAQLSAALLLLFSAEIALLAAISRRHELSNDALLRMSLEVQLTFERLVRPDNDAHTITVSAPV